MKLHTTGRTTAALLLALGLFAAGCGKSSTKDTTPAATEAASSAAPATEAAASEAVATEAAATEAVADTAAAAAAAPADIKLVNAGKVTVCSDIPYAPFEYYENGADGKVISA